VLVTTSQLVLANAVALIAGTSWLARLTLPSSQGVRVRNAFLLQRGDAKDFAWTPANVPPGFRVEKRRAPQAILNAATAARVADGSGDWKQARELVTMLVRNWKLDGAIQADLATTYDGIVAGSGYCADYVRVYLAAASAVGLFCRQWAFSFDDFGGHGHTFVEIYDGQRGKWVFLDVHNNVYASAAGTDEPLGCLELRRALIDGTAIEFRRAGEGRLGFRHFDKLLDYYRRGVEQWYLWWGNDVITRDVAGISGALMLISGRLANIVTSAFCLPPIMAIVTPANEDKIAAMERLRRHVVATLIVVACLATLGGLQFAIGRLWH
jgi:hypothetical protein